MRSIALLWASDNLPSLYNKTPYPKDFGNREHLALGEGPFIEYPVRVNPEYELTYGNINPGPEPRLYVAPPDGLPLQETSDEDEVSGPVRTGEVLADPANAPSKGATI